MSTRVMLVDDHRLFREGLRTLLESEEGFEVVGEADNGRDSIRLIRSIEPDVVVMDVAMPELNGIDAAHKVAGLGLECRVLALSMHSDELYVKGMLQAGAAGYLLKDCAAEELVQAIRTVMSDRVYVSPDVAGVIVSDYVAHLSGTVVANAPALSAREREVLQLIAEGHSTAQIAERLHVGVKTVETHRKHLMDKLDIHSVAGLTKYAIRQGVSSVHD